MAKHIWARETGTGHADKPTITSRAAHTLSHFPNVHLQVHSTSVTVSAYPPRAPHSRVGRGGVCERVWVQFYWMWRTREAGPAPQVLCALCGRRGDFNVSWCDFGASWSNKRQQQEHGDRQVSTYHGSTARGPLLHACRYICCNWYVYMYNRPTRQTFYWAIDTACELRNRHKCPVPHKCINL